MKPRHLYSICLTRSNFDVALIKLTEITSLNEYISNIKNNGPKIIQELYSSFVFIFEQHGRSPKDQPDILISREICAKMKDISLKS